MTQAGTINSVLTPIHKAGWPFIAIFLAASFVLGWLWDPLLWLGLIATAWCTYFFRDPARTTIVDPACISSPADGVVLHTHARVPPPELLLGSEPLPCVGVFMNVFDVHVNRTPMPGKIVRLEYHAGKFFNAAMDKASDDNERQSFVIEAETGERVGLVQIAGLVARRILAFEKAGNPVGPGQRVGLIRFGSKCDVYLPKGVVPRVAIGQKCVAGETVLAHLSRQEPEVTGTSQ